MMDERDKSGLAGAAMLLGAWWISGRRVNGLGLLSEVVDILSLHDPDWARENDWYWVSRDGSYGYSKPRELGVRSMHQFGRQLFPQVNWIDWPDGEEYVVLRSKEDAKRVRQELADRWIRAIKVYIEHGT